MAYTKASIVEEICEKIGLPKKEAIDVVELLFETIKNTLVERDGSLKISGFGTFSIRQKKSRVGRNPQTGEQMEITARRVITFKPSQVLRDALNS